MTVRIELPPPRIETHEPPPDIVADSDCPARQAKTSDRVSPGFICPENDVVYAPRPNLSRVVDGYDARSGAGVGVAAGVEVGVGLGVEGVCVAAGDDVGVGLIEEITFDPFVFLGGSLRATVPEFK